MYLKGEAKDARERYDEWAKEYENELLNDFEYVAPKLVAEKFLPYLKKGQTILELGCGTGLNSTYYYKKGCKLIGVDISKKSLEEAEKKGTYQKLYQANLEERLDFNNEKFDNVLCVGVFEYFKTLDHILKEMARVTKRKGYITFTVPSTRASDLYKHTLGSVKEVLKKNKLRIIELFRFRAYVEPATNNRIFNWGIISKKL